MISSVTLSPGSRFSNRVENYVKYRPGYPAAVFTYLEESGLLRPSSCIADIGSGTGLFAEQLLQKGYQVVGIEPNDAMRQAGEERLKKYPNFYSRKHRAEATGLRNHSVDLITVAQAFHWFNPTASRREFQRILRPGGQVVLAWNLLKMQNEFLKYYADIKERYRMDESQLPQTQADEINHFFDPLPVTRHRFPNLQLLNFDGLKGQLLSSSYIPLPGHTSYEAMISELIQLFLQYNENGYVRMEYETTLYIGQLL